MKNRLFISLNLPDTVIHRLISIRDSIFPSVGVKWEPAEKLHITLKFIGDVSTELTREISDELDFITDYTSFKGEIYNFGTFYKDNKPSILWAGITPRDLLSDLVVEINLRLIKFSIKSENRKFKPHITLLRIKKSEITYINSDKNLTFEPIQFTADTITLYRSILHPWGSQYEKIKNYKLN